MSFIAGRRCRINGRDYQAGEVVDTTGIRRFQTLVAARYLVPAPEPAPEIEATDEPALLAASPEPAPEPEPVLPKRTRTKAEKDA